jgi:hypothetical protein
MIEPLIKSLFGNRCAPSNCYFGLGRAAVVLVADTYAHTFILDND